MAVTKEYKTRLTTYMHQLVNEVEGIGDCQISFVMEEDYQTEAYGIVKRIYVTAYEGEEESVATPNSGFSQMAPISKIEIDLDGITMVPTEEKVENDHSPLKKEISHVLQEAFNLDETCIFVEVKDA